jgi:hypothetical protein
MRKREEKSRDVKEGKRGDRMIDMDIRETALKYLRILKAVTMVVSIMSILTDLLTISYSFVFSSPYRGFGMSYNGSE